MAEANSETPLCVLKNPYMRCFYIQLDPEQPHGEAYFVESRREGESIEMFNERVNQTLVNRVLEIRENALRAGDANRARLAATFLERNRADFLERSLQKSVLDVKQAVYQTILEAVAPS